MRMPSQSAFCMGYKITQGKVEGFDEMRNFNCVSPEQERVGVFVIIVSLKDVVVLFLRKSSKYCRHF